MEDDRSIWPTLVSLRDCLCGALDDAGVETCFCDIQAGDVALLEYVNGKGTMAWVRLVGSFPSQDFPNADVGAVCGTMLGHEIEVGIARCFALATKAPTAEQYREGARLLAADQALMRKAIECCLVGSDLQYVLGQWEPNGPRGGVLWSTWQLTVEGEWLV